MVQCKFYARGYCKYGEDCRFEHDSPQPTGRRNNNSFSSSGNTQRFQQPQSYFGAQQSQPVRQSYFGAQQSQPVRQSYFGQPQQPVRQSYFGQQQPAKHDTHGRLTHEQQQYLTLVERDSLEWEHGSQWPFSVYAPLLRRVLTNPARPAPWEENLPGLHDISPDELHWEALQAHSRGQFPEYVNHLQALIESVQKIRRALQKLDPATSQYIIGFERGDNVSPAGTALDVSNVPPMSMAVSVVQQPEKKAFTFSLPARSAPAPPSVAATSFSFKLPAQSQQTFSQPQQSLFQQPAVLQPVSQIQQQSMSTVFQQPQPFGSQPFFQQQPASIQQVPEKPHSALNDHPSLSQSDLEQFKADKFSFGLIPRIPPPKEFR